MRSRDEIAYMVKNPAKYMPYDLYQVGLVELYPFVDISLIPKPIVDRIPSEVRDSWDPDEECSQFNLKERVNDEADYVIKLLENQEEIPAVFRFPRLLSVLWLGGVDISDLETQYKMITVPKVSKSTAKAKLMTLCKDIKRLV